MDSPRIVQAHELMTRAHAGQTRKGGQPYATHPAAVMQILRDQLGVGDEDALIAALLHDVVEDTPITANQIASQFGQRVSSMVLTLTKQPSAGESKEAMLARYFITVRQADNLIRQIKLADRIHNLREMGDATASFRMKYLAETKDLIEVVLADTPGLSNLIEEYNRSISLYPQEARTAGVTPMT